MVGPADSGAALMPIRIGRHEIGQGAPFVVAEAGVNHNGDPALAMALVDAAADTGADAVKFQTFRADALAVASAPQAAYQRERSAASSQREMLASLELPVEALAALQRQATRRGIVFLSTPFDGDSLDALLALDVPAIKISSGDLTNLPLLRQAAASGLPLILSTGMATESEVAQVVAALRGARLILMQCTSAYPAPPADANLRAMTTLADRFAVPVGYSDHTQGIAVALAATALGAVMIEKHLTLDRSMTGPDHAASLDPVDFARLVEGIRAVVASLGSGVKEPAPSEEGMRLVARRSLVTAHPLRPGQVLTHDDLVAKRPGSGISPMAVDRLVGATVRRPLPADHLVSLDDLDEVARDPAD